MTPHLICQILPNTSKLVQGRYTRKKMGNSRKGKNAKCLSEENRELLQFAKLNNFTFWHLCNEESQKKKTPIRLHFYNLSAVHLLMMVVVLNLGDLHQLAFGCGSKISSPQTHRSWHLLLAGHRLLPRQAKGPTPETQDSICHHLLHKKNGVHLPKTGKNCRNSSSEAVKINTARMPAGSPLLSFCFCLLDNA